MSSQTLHAKGPRRALVLSGGGARGAYEAGVLHYILEALPDYLGHRPRFDIISGTSVGAINAAWLAATIDRPAVCARRMTQLWGEMRFAKVVQPAYREIWRLMRRFFVDAQIGRPAPLPTDSREGGLLRTAFFDDVIRREIPFENIGHNLGRGVFESVSVSCTEIATGRTVVFLQTANGVVPPWGRDSRRVALHQALSAPIVLASAAIPLVFPAVKIGGHWFCDGGLRQNTPISPALRLGADRVLVVSLQSKRNLDMPLSMAEEDPAEYAHPNLSFLIGKLLDALLLDPLDYDLAVLERINALLRDGSEAYDDPGFIDKINTVVGAHRGQGYRIVEPLLLRASQDLGELASEYAKMAPGGMWGSAPLRFVGQKALENRGSRESDFLSYLLFDAGYTRQLLDLGYRDAEARRDELVAFFG